MTSRSFTAFLTIALIVSTEAAAAVAQKCSSPPPKAAEITEISLSYTGGHFAASSGFTLILRKDGTAAFEGAKNSSRAGDFVGTFDKKEFAKLAKFIVAQEFFAFENDYIQNIQDGGMTTTRVCFAGGEKTVRNNSWRKSQSADNRLPDIENAVSAIDSRLLIRWKKSKK